ncbi:MAG: copper transport protein [Solirubrobacteraceae bacterium]|nr:copper transport protein [Solirubrobacteraceae bacterium]
MSERTTSVGRRVAVRRPTVAFVAAVALAWALPAAASAHAVLQHTTPHQNAAVGAAPSSVRLDFNEAVEVSFGAVRVYDQRGRRVDSGDVAHPDGRQHSVTVGVRGGLGRGVYTTTYRVVSADGHPVSGGFAFGVGEPVTARRGTPQVADLLARSSAGPAVEGAYGVARGLHYAALLLLVGAVFFGLLVWPVGSTARWPRRALLVAAIVGLLAALAGIALQGALGGGVSLGHALDSAMLRGSLETRTGHTWLLRSAAWALLVVVLALRRGDGSRWERLGLGLPVAFLVGTLPYAGHADTQAPRALLIPADVLHVLAAGAWLGGLVLLLVCFWPRRGAPLGDGAAQATARFSRLALPAIVVLVAAGSAQAWFYLGSVGAFLRTTYGWALLAKIVLVSLIVALAAGSRRRTARLDDGEIDTARRLRRAMRAEVACAVLVLAATATLVRAAPPATIDDGPVVRELDLGPMRLQMDVEPAAVGPNDYHLYLFDRRTGAQIDRVEQLTVRLVQRDKAIGPITLDVPRAGRAHYELRDSALGVRGTWEATVVARVSDFDEYSATTRFEVRGR